MTALAGRVAAPKPCLKVGFGPGPSAASLPECLTSMSAICALLPAEPGIAQG